MHSDTNQKGLGAQRNQNALRLYPSLNYISGDWGVGIEFQRTKVCLNEFPAPLMLRGGRASKRGGIEGEFTAGSIRACLLQTKTGGAQNDATLPESEGDAE